MACINPDGLSGTLLAEPQLRRLVAGFPPRPGFQLRSCHVGFVVNKMALGQVFSEYLGFLCQFSFHRLLHIQHHLSSGAGTIGQLVADVPSGLSLTPSQETKENKLYFLLTSSFLGPNIFLSSLFPFTCNLRSSFKIDYHVSGPYKTSCKVITFHKKLCAYTISFLDLLSPTTI
jgi:hypothetical protein